MASLPFPTPRNPLSSPPTPYKTHKSSIKFHKTHNSKPLQNIKNSIQSPTKSYLHQISSLCRERRLQEAFALLSQMESIAVPIGPEVYGELLQGCLYERAIDEGQQIHARILKNGAFFYKNEYIETKVLIFYAKCDCFPIAEALFLRQQRPNVFSWAAMLGLYSRHGFSEKALVGFVEMMETSSFPDNFVIPNALKACSGLQFVGLGRGIHGCALKLGFGSCIYVLSSLVDFYGKCGLLEEARKVFEEMPERNVVAWNSMLVGLVQNGMNEEALEMFVDMRIGGVELTRVSIASFLSASANLLAVDEGKQGHALSLFYGLEMDNVLGSSIINFYCKVGLIEDAETIFYKIVDKDVVTWNLMISGYVQDGDVDKALDTCYEMRKEKLKFDSVTLSSIISACADSGKIELGRSAHAFCIRNNLVLDLVIASSMIDFYASCGRLECAQLVFDITTPRDLVLWNTLISAYAQYGRSGEALKLFYQMQLEGVPSNVISWNSVILGLLRNGQVIEAKEFFSQMQINGVNANLITWTTLIFGLAQNGYGHEAIQYFEQMQFNGIRPNTTSIVGLLLACTNAVWLRYGSIVHGHIMRQELQSSLWVATSLVDMYAKCGSIQQAEKVFKMVLNKELPLYNSMISGLSLHGHANEALALYGEMCEEGLEPDSITFTGLLAACSHSGLMAEGLKIFTEMVSKYHIVPQKEHYGCLVTLLTRFGNFNEALKLLSAMPLDVDPHIVGSLLAACKEHQEIELGEYILSHLLSLEPTNLANYVTLANMYAFSGRWQRASKVRTLMRETGFAKNPGCSWIQLGNELHAFLVGDKSHPQIDVISETLLCLHNEMKVVGCASNQP